MNDAEGKFSDIYVVKWLVGPVKCNLFLNERDKLVAAYTGSALLKPLYNILTSLYIKDGRRSTEIFLSFKNGKSTQYHGGTFVNLLLSKYFGEQGFRCWIACAKTSRIMA